MSFWRRHCPGGDCEEQSASGSTEQQRRSIQADKKYYSAMRHLAWEADDAAGMRFYERRLKEIQSLEDELDVMKADRSDT